MYILLFLRFDYLRSGNAKCKSNCALTDGLPSFPLEFSSQYSLSAECTERLYAYPMPYADERLFGLAVTEDGNTLHSTLVCIELPSLTRVPQAVGLFKVVVCARFI